MCYNDGLLVRKFSCYISTCSSHDSIHGYLTLKDVFRSLSGLPSPDHGKSQGRRSCHLHPCCVNCKRNRLLRIDMSRSTSFFVGAHRPPHPWQRHMSAAGERSSVVGDRPNTSNIMSRKPSLKPSANQQSTIRARSQVLEFVDFFL